MADKNDQNVNTGAATTGGTNADGANVTKPTTEPGKDQNATQEPKDPLSELKPEIIAALDKKYQAEIDRRVNKFVAENNDLKKRVDQLQTERMTDKEKAEYELKKQKEEVEAAKLQIELEKANYYKTKLAAEMGLPVAAQEFITGRTNEEIQESAKKFKAILESVNKSAVEAVLKGTNTTPTKTGGGPVVNTLKPGDPGYERSAISAAIEAAEKAGATS